MSSGRNKIEDSDSSDDDIFTNEEHKAEANASRMFSDSDDSDDSDNAKTNTSSQENNKNSENGDNMNDLFGSGSESEEEFTASGVKESPTRIDRRASAENDDSDGNAHEDSLCVQRRPNLSADASVFVTKLPNIIRIESNTFDKETFEKDNPQDEETAEDNVDSYVNTIRWRYKRDDKDNVMRDSDTGKMIRESNTKIVQWEDGTYTMFVGKEAISLTKQSITNEFLYTKQQSIVQDNSETLLECLRAVPQKLTMRPMTTSSASHRRLTLTMRQKHGRSARRVKEYISDKDPDKDKMTRGKMKEDQIRLQMRKKSRDDYENDRYRQERMSASFLEGEDGVEYDDDNLSAIKEKFGGKGRSSSRSKKAPRSESRRHSRSQPTRDGYDEYDQRRSRQEQNDDDSPVVDDDDDDDDDDGAFVVSTSKKRKKAAVLDSDSD